MTIEEQLLEATAAISGVTAERDDLRATVEKLTVGAASELEALKVEAASKDAKLAELTAALEVAVKEVEGFKAMVADIEASTRPRWTSLICWAEVSAVLIRLSA